MAVFEERRFGMTLTPEQEERFDEKFVGTRSDLGSPYLKIYSPTMVLELKEHMEEEIALAVEAERERILKESARFGIDTTCSEDVIKGFFECKRQLEDLLTPKKAE